MSLSVSLHLLLSWGPRVRHWSVGCSLFGWSSWRVFWDTLVASVSKAAHGGSVGTIHIIHRVKWVDLLPILLVIWGVNRLSLLSNWVIAPLIKARILLYWWRFVHLWCLLLKLNQLIIFKAANASHVVLFDLVKSRIKRVFCVPCKVFLVNFSSNWISNLDRVWLFDGSLFCDLLVSLPPLWVNHLLLSQFKGSSGRLLSLSLNRVLGDSISPSWGGSASGDLSRLSLWSNLLNLLFLRWLFALLTSQDSVISFGFKFGFWIYLRATLHSLLFLFSCFIRFEKGLHGSWRLMLVKITSVSSIYELDWNIFWWFFSDDRCWAFLHHDFVNWWRLRKLWRNWILIIILDSHLRLTFHKVNLFGFWDWLSL